MSRRTDLLQQLIQSDKFGEEKKQEQQFLMATAELVLYDLINIALSGVEKHGAGSLVINLHLCLVTLLNLILRLLNEKRILKSLTSYAS